MPKVYYFSDDAGYHTGFSTELLHAVCKEAGVECKTVMDEDEHCVSTAGTGKDLFHVAGIGELESHFVL